MACLLHGRSAAWLCNSEHGRQLYDHRTQSPSPELAPYNNYEGGSSDATVKYAVQCPTHEPSTRVPMLTTATQHIGVGAPSILTTNTASSECVRPGLACSLPRVFVRPAWSADGPVAQLGVAVGTHSAGIVRTLRAQSRCSRRRRKQKVVVRCNSDTYTKRNGRWYFQTRSYQVTGKL